MLPPYKPTRRLSLGRSRHFVWASRTPDIRLSSGCSEIGIGSSNPARSANESSTFAILQRDEAVSPRLAEAYRRSGTSETHKASERTYLSLLEARAHPLEAARNEPRLHDLVCARQFNQEAERIRYGLQQFATKSDGP
jgi:hypothetical protein